jgi:hypothetical protein
LASPDGYAEAFEAASMPTCAALIYRPWAMVRQKNGSESDYAAALEMAEAMDSSGPCARAILNVLGVARYRNKNIEAARQTFVDLRRVAEPSPLDATFFAMCDFRRGDNRAAEIELQRARELLRKPAYAKTTYQRFLHEAADLISSGKASATGTAQNLDFEMGTAVGGVPVGWLFEGSRLGYSISVDTQIVHSGRASAQIRFGGDTASGFASLANEIKAQAYRDRRLRLSGYLRSEGVSTGWAGLWIRVDGPNGSLGLDNMHDRGIHGTKDWSRFEIVMPIPKEATRIVFGALHCGVGVVWLDSLSLEVVQPDSNPAELAPRD